MGKKKLNCNKGTIIIVPDKIQRAKRNKKTLSLKFFFSNKITEVNDLIRYIEEKISTEKNTISNSLSSDLENKKKNKKIKSLSSLNTYNKNLTNLNKEWDKIKNNLDQNETLQEPELQEIEKKIEAINQKLREINKKIKVKIMTGQNSRQTAQRTTSNDPLQKLWELYLEAKDQKLKDSKIIELLEIKYYIISQHSQKDTNEDYY